MRVRFYEKPLRISPRLMLGMGLVGVIFSAVVVLSSPGARAQQSIPNIPNLDVTNLTPEQIQNLIQQRSQVGDTNTSRDLNPTFIRPAPTTANGQQAPASRLEQIMSTRAGSRLEQFGYDQFGNAGSVQVLQTGAIQDDYILGPGDELDISLRGQENSQQKIIVDRNGQVVIPRLAPLSAAGNTLGTFRRTLSDMVSRSYVATQAFVSVGRLRQISVVVAGEVNNPGQRIMNALNSPLDAILISGGVRKTGSLRSIKLIRSGRQTNIDLYGVLTGTAAARLVQLTDGDRIVVSPLGPTVAAAGWVRRPGIYELPSGQNSLTVRALTSLAGGLEVRGLYRWSVLRVNADGSTSLVALVGDTGVIRDSEILFAQPGAVQATGQATLTGPFPMAGGYSVTGGVTRLSDIISGRGAQGETPYSLFGIISRRDDRTQLRSLISFAPSAVSRGTNDVTLQPSGDIVRMFTQNEARLLIHIMQLYRDRLAGIEDSLRNPLSEDSANSASAAANKPRNSREIIDELSVMTMPDIVNPRPAPRIDLAEGGRNASFPQQVAGGVPQATASAQISGNMQSGLYRDDRNDPMRANQARLPAQALPLNYQEQVVAEGSVASNVEVKTFGQIARQLNIDALVLVNFLLDRSVSLDGALRGPGVYLVGPGVDLNDLVAAAGGSTDKADMNDVEIITLDSSLTSADAPQRQILSLNQTTIAGYVVKPRDRIRFKERYDDSGSGAVTIQGEVRNPGAFQIRRGEKLSEVLVRAGGLTNVAYPYGAVFLRKSAAVREQQGYEREAQELEKQLALGLTRATGQQSGTDIASAIRLLVENLRSQKALGRINVMADPAVLITQQELDLLLEPGDVLFVPQRPATVAVLGEVMSTGSFISRPELGVQDFIDNAGGYTRFADKSLTFVILPDGSARKVDNSWLQISEPSIPPGSTIVVPRDLAPFDWGDFATRTTQIVSQLAVSAASIAVLSKD